MQTQDQMSEFDPNATQPHDRAGTMIAATVSTAGIVELVDTQRLSYQPGYPSAIDPSVRLQWWSFGASGEPEARLECAIVRDHATAMVVASPGVSCQQHTHAEYEYAQQDGVPTVGVHRMRVVWRLVRISDESVLHDSLMQAPLRDRVVAADIPVAWGHVIRALRARGELTAGRSLGGWE